jgi:GntR family transcriptional regulator
MTLAYSLPAANAARKMLHCTIDLPKMSTAPLYKEIREKLLASITRGMWPPGNPLPSEATLAREFEVSVGTLRKAVDELVLEKVLQRQQGRGTFVAAHNVDRTLQDFFRVRHADGVTRFPEVETLALRRQVADAETAQRLQLASGARVVRIINLLGIAGTPVALDRIFLPAERFEGLSLEVFRQRPGTIYHLYQHRFGVNVLRGEDHVRACRASAREARALHLRRGTPMLEIERISRTYYDVPVEWRCSRVHTEQHFYVSELG